MSERTELFDLIADTRAYLLFLKETGVEEMFAKSTAEARSKKQEAKNTIARETSMSVLLTKDEENGTILRQAQDDKHIVMEPCHGELVEPFSNHDGQLGTFSDNNKGQLLNALLQKIGDCQQCKLSTGRTNIVFGTGNPEAKLMFIGEGPCEEEDKQGKPFVGKAGELLTKMIAAMGLTRDDVYIANVVKCRPPGNRNPEGDEIASCSPFLKEQINIIKPEIICTLGTFASQTLLESYIKISDLRGRIHLKNGYRIVPTFHPAYLLRNPGEKVRSWQDLQIIMKELGLKTVNSG